MIGNVAGSFRFLSTFQDNSVMSQNHSEMVSDSYPVEEQLGSIWIVDVSGHFIKCPDRKG